ncbi:MAG: hypothetical protein ACI308_09815 [Muribaculaceae bacterium]
MKQTIVTIISVLLFASCTQNDFVPNKSILEEIPFDELTEVFEYERTHESGNWKFQNLYPVIRSCAESMNEIERAKYAKLTYRELYNAGNELCDSAASAEIKEQWNQKYESYLPQAKAISQTMYQDILAKYKEFVRRYQVHAFELWLSENNYDRYLNERIYHIWDSDICDYSEDLWNYENIIKDKIDSDFECRFMWVATKKLDRIKDKYPLAHMFFNDLIIQLSNYVDFTKIDEQGNINQYF